MDLTEGLACLTDGQPIGGDQDHGHSMEMWELGWSNPGQDGSMHHGRVGHSCDGLIHQVCCSPNLSWIFRSGVYPYRRIATPSCILCMGMLSDTSHKLHSGEAR